MADLMCGATALLPVDRELPPWTSEDLDTPPTMPGLQTRTIRCTAPAGHNWRVAHYTYEDGKRIEWPVLRG